MTQKDLAERYKGRYGADTKGIASLAASIKRTQTALVGIEAQFNDSLSLKERSALESCRTILGRLARLADSAKTDVKRHAAEKQRLQERLRREAFEAFPGAFGLYLDAARGIYLVDQVEDAVAFLAWDHPLKEWLSSGCDGWDRSIREEMTADELWHKYRRPNVMGELRGRVSYLVKELIDTVAREAERKGRTVAEIVVEASADYQAKRPAILKKWQPLIQDIKAAGVAQTLESAKRGQA